MKLGILFTLGCVLQFSMQHIRSTYLQAINNSNKADELVQTTENRVKNGSLYRAYYATGLALQAKYSWSPYVKLTKAKKAAIEFNSAVTTNSKNLEIRFLRFSFEENLPDILKITKHSADDKKYILENLDKNNAIWSTIKSYLIKSNSLTESEKLKVRNL